MASKLQFQLARGRKETQSVSKEPLIWLSFALHYLQADSAYASFYTRRRASGE